MWGRSLVGLECVIVACAACSGTAIVDGENSATGGGDVTTTGTNTTGTTGTTSTGTTGTTTVVPTTCGSVEACCDAACKHVESLACWQAGDECECGVFGGPGCNNAWSALLQCLVDKLPGSLQCIDGTPNVVCGYCDAQIAQAEMACGQPFPCSFE
jgi:hypothetical protein